jgi:membrane protease YdiL (CAAX protease family)
VEPHLKRWQVVVATVVGMVAGQGFAIVGMIGFVVVAAVVRGLTEPEDLKQITTSFGALVAGSVPVQLVLAATAFVTVALTRKPLWRTLGLVPVPWPAFVAAVLAALGAGPLSGTVVWAMRRLLPRLTLDALTVLNDQILTAPYAALVVVIVLLPGFGEELFFRGLLQRGLGRSPWTIVVAASVFALYHVDPHHVAGALVLGLVFGWLAWRTDSIWPPIVGHLTNNLVAITAPRVTKMDLDAPPTWPALVGGALALALAWLVVVRWVPRPGAAGERGRSLP